jgi:NAD(P)H dehydrogenase (quinone)
MSTWLVTGATGNVGSAALRALTASNPKQHLAALVRDADRARRRVPSSVELRVADYDDRDALATAFSGVTRLLWIASDGAGPDVLRHHANVQDAALAADVDHIVFTSIVDIDPDSAFYFTPVYREAERALAACGRSCTVLRCSLYADFLIDHWIAPAFTSGVLAVPAGDARAAPVCRDDVALAAAGALSAQEPPQGIYRLTGSRAYTFAEMAELASRIQPVPLRYVPLSPADYLGQCWATLQDPWPHAFGSLFASIREGRYAAVSDDLQALLGRRPTELEALLKTSLALHRLAAWGS